MKKITHQEHTLYVLRKPDGSPIKYDTSEKDVWKRETDNSLHQYFVLLELGYFVTEVPIMLEFNAEKEQ